MDNSNVTPQAQHTEIPIEKKTFPIKRISWSSVFAGVLVAIVIQLGLSILGIGIGLSTIDVMQEQNPTEGLGIGTAIWYGLSSLISLYAGGWVAGRLARTPRIFDGIMHGILSWSLVTLLSFYLLTTTIGSIIGGVGSLVGNALGTVGNLAAKGVSAVAPAVGDEIEQRTAGISGSDVKAEIKEILRQTGKDELQPENLEKQGQRAGSTLDSTVSQTATNPQNAGSTIDAAFERLFSRGQNAISAVDKEAAVNVVVARTGKSRPEAEQIVDNWISTYQQASAKVTQLTQEASHTAKQAADATADALSTACIIAFFSMLLGAVAAGFGARNGTFSKEHAETV